MHYQDNDLKTDLKPEEVLSFVRTEFADFDRIIDIDIDIDIDNGMYDTLGDFAIYLRNGISEKSLSEENLKKAFKVMNTMGASKELEVQNLLVVGILEILTDEGQVVSVVKEGLTGSAAELFERVLIGWNSS